MSYLLLKGKDIRITATGIIKVLKVIEHTHIVCTGISGVLLSSVVAARTNKTLVILRKNSDSTHGHRIENNLGVVCVRPCVFIDDLMDTGDTLIRVLETLEEDFLKSNLFLKAIVFYNQYNKEEKMKQASELSKGVPIIFV